MKNPIKFYKENLREELKYYKKIASGFTSSIYANLTLDLEKPSFIIKEIYLNDVLEKSNKYNELFLNIYFREHSRYLKHVVPMISYDTYNRVLLMKFPYMGIDLETYLMENIYSLDSKILNKIYKKITQAIQSLNKKVNHNDLHTANIFVNPDTFEVRIGDWGKGELKIEKENSSAKDSFTEEEIDFEFFKTSFISDICFAYFKNTYTKKDLDSMILKKILNNKINKNMDYIQRKFPYKPKFFYPDLRKYLFKRIYKSMLMKTTEFQKQNYLPEDIKNFLKFL
jgi:hypothetical protein